MPRPGKSGNTSDYSLTLNNLYIALYENNNNPYTKAGAVFGFRRTLTGETLDKLLNQSRSEEEATKQETQPFMTADDYSRVLKLYTRKGFIYKGSQKRFFIAHLGGWRSARVTLSQKTDVIFNGNNKADGGVRAEFCEDFGSWKCFTDDSGNYVFFWADDFIGRTKPKGTRSIAEYIVSCNYHLISQYCERKELLKDVIYAFAENMEDDERKRSGKKGLNNLYDEHQDKIKRLKDCLEKLVLTYENSDNIMEKDWSLARALSYLVIGAMLRETLSCKLIEENFEEYLPKSDKTGFGKDVADEGGIKKSKTALSVSEQFWQAGRTWYEEARKPGARFHSLDIVNVNFS